MALRIALVSFEYPPDSGFGGIATYVAQAAALLTARGHNVEVFASSTIRNHCERIDGILVHWMLENNRDDFPVVAGHRIAERHKQQAFDVLESPEYFADGRKAIELLPQLPLVVRLHTPSRLIIEMSWSHPSYYPLTRFRELVKSFLMICLNKSGKIPFVNPKQYWYSIDQTEKQFTRKANRVVALCHDMKLFAQGHWKIDPTCLVVSPNVYHPNKQLLAIQPNQRGMCFGYFGRLERRKGVDLWVKAIPGILKQFPEARFRFVGKSMNYSSGLTYLQWIKSYLNDHLDRIDFVDHVPLSEMPHQYELVDICVFPSRWENFPNVCLEAMSAGKAVVASHFGGMAEMLPTPEFGLTINPFNTNELIEAACRLLKNPEERIRMGMAARERVLKEYNHDRIGQAMESIYHEAIANKQHQILKSNK